MTKEISQKPHNQRNSSKTGTHRKSNSHEEQEARCKTLLCWIFSRKIIGMLNNHYIIEHQETWTKMHENEQDDLKTFNQIGQIDPN